MVCVTSNLYWNYDSYIDLDRFVVRTSLMYLILKAYKTNVLCLYLMIALPGLLGYAYSHATDHDDTFRYHCLNHIFGHFSNFVFY